jgi:hypothetical protein
MIAARSDLAERPCDADKQDAGAELLVHGTFTALPVKDDIGNFRDDSPALPLTLEFRQYGSEVKKSA